MLGGAILIIVVVLFCGIRACSGSNKGNSGDEQKTTSEDQGNVPSSPISEGESDEKEEDANPMETADADVTALITSYYQALGEKDIATLKTLEDDFTPSDESKVTNLKDYIEGYEVGDVYTKKGMTDDSYVVYACFSYICQGVETKAPALTQFYVYKNSEGNWVINNGALQDSEISAYMEKQLSDSDVSALIKRNLFQKLYDLINLVRIQIYIILLSNIYYDIIDIIHILDIIFDNLYLRVIHNSSCIILSNLISQISCHYHFLCSKFFLRAVKLLPCSCLVRHLNTCKRSGAGYLKRAGGYNFTVLDT